MGTKQYPIKKLKEFTDVFSGFAFKSTDLKEGDIPVIKIANIQDKQVNKECSAFFSSSKLTRKLDKYFLQDDDFLIAMTGAGSVGKTGKMRGKNKKYLVNQRVGIVRVKKGLANQEFIFQVISQDYYEDILYKLGLGAGQPNISAKDIGNIEISFPEKIIQDKLASIFLNYSNLIENNKKRIQLLEKIAKLIYDKWFVKFKFPGHEKVKMVDSELGKIPEGWEVSKIDNVIKHRIHINGKIKKSEFLDRGIIPCVDQSKSFIAGYTNDGKSVFNEFLPIIVFGDHTRIIKFVNFPFACGADGTQLIYPGKDSISPEFLYFSLMHIDLSNFHYARHLKFLKSQKVFIPNEWVVKKFTEIVKPIMEEIQFYRNSIYNLRKTRDLLLPKLINGNIDVSELDIKVPEAEA